MNKRFATTTAVFVSLLGITGISLPTLAGAADVMTIVDGQVGILTPTPTAPLDVNIGTATPGIGNSLLRLERNGPLAFQLKDTDDPTGKFWQFSNALGGNVFRIQKSGSGGVQRFELNKNGNLTIAGSIFTAGGTCGGGCDRVFDGDYELPTIEEHAQQMWVKRHLPAVGPTEEMQPVNLSEQYGRMLNELETAHIYIDQLNGEKQDLRRKVDSLESRLGELEAQLSR